MKIMFGLLFMTIYTVGNVYFFSRMYKLFILSQHPAVKVIYVLLAVFLTASLLIAFLFRQSIPDSLTTVFYRMGTSWFFIIIYLIMMIGIFNLLVLLNKTLHIIPVQITQTYPTDSRSFMLAIFGLITIIFSWGFYRYNKKERVEITITVDKPMKKDLTLAFVSDLHLGYNTGADEFKRWVNIINKEQPDILLIGGDMIDNSILPIKDSNIDLICKEINAPLGIYMCPGNHEYFSRNENFDYIKQCGIHMLKDAAVLINDDFYIAGRDDKSNPARSPLANLLENVNKNKPVILLDHQPFHLEEAMNNNIDLQLSGHTHYGQILPVSWITELMYEKAHGFLKKGNTNYFVSSGIGIWGGKFRIGTQSEYVIIHLNGNSN